MHNEISSQHPFSMQCNFGSWGASAIVFENQSAAFKQYDSRQNYTTARSVVNNSQQYRRQMTPSSEQKWRAGGAVLIQRLPFKAAGWKKI